MKTRAFALTVALTAAAVGAGLGLAQEAGATVRNCPAQPPPASGTTLNGDLNVTGTCVVTNVTIKGNVTIQSGGALELDSSVVQDDGSHTKGNVTVNAGGEFDSGATLHTGAANGKSSTIKGRLIYNNGSDMDFIKGGIQGGSTSVKSLVVTGTDGFPKVCGAGITHGLTLQSIPTAKSFRLGDPDGDNGSVCAANAIRGNVVIQNNVGSIVMEGNGVVGNVTIDHSTVKFADNVIRGNLSCTSTGHVTGASGNHVSGTNTCGAI